MTQPLIPIITSAGLAAVFNADNNGLQAKITQVALGDVGWTPDGAATALENERLRVAIASSKRVQPNQIHLIAEANGPGDFWVSEVGFFLDDGSLLAVWSHPDLPLAYKSSTATLRLAFDLLLTALPDGSVTVIDDGSGGQDYDLANDTTVGVVRLATPQEAIKGTLKGGVAMSPANVTEHGKNRYAGVVHDHLWKDIEDAPSSFPPAPHAHDWDEVSGKPAQFPPANHTHGWSDITKKPSKFPPTAHTHDQYIDASKEKVTTGYVGMAGRATQPGWPLYENFFVNVALIAPPVGFDMSHLQVFFASPGVIFFGGEVDANDRLYCRWRLESERIRVICANTENTVDDNGHPAYVNYFALWRK